MYPCLSTDVPIYKYYKDLTTLRAITKKLNLNHEKKSQNYKYIICVK